MSDLEAECHEEYTPELVTVTVMNEKRWPKKYSVHQWFLCKYSPTLEIALGDAFRSQGNWTYQLNDTTHGAFELFLQWIYGQNLDLQIPTLGSAEKSAETVERVAELTKAHGRSLAELWILADKLHIPRLQNLIIDALAKLHKERKMIFTESLHFVYRNTPVNSPIRLFLVDQAWFCAAQEQFINDSLDFPHEMLLELASSVTSNLVRGIYYVDDSKPASDFHVPN